MLVQLAQFAETLLEIAAKIPPEVDWILRVDGHQVVAHLSRILPDNSCVSNGAGNYTVWVHRFFQYKTLGTELAPTNGAMGYGLPAAIAAIRQQRERDPFLR